LAELFVAAQADGAESTARQITPKTFARMATPFPRTFDRIVLAVSARANNRRTAATWT